MFREFARHGPRRGISTTPQRFRRCEPIERAFSHILSILPGFGEDGHDAQWPNGARIAVSFVLNYEEGGERNPLDGDGTSEPYLWEKGPSGGGREQRHLNGEQDYEYGSRCGAWRILRLMKEFGWNMTLWAIAVAMERNPTFAKACVREGHEIGAHGYRWLDIWDYSLEDDKAYIKQTCKALEAATGMFRTITIVHGTDATTGEFPVGAYFGRGTPNTASLLPIMWKEMGHKMLYTSEVYNEDSPYWIDLPWEKELPDMEKEGLLMMPYNYDCKHTPHVWLFQINKVVQVTMASSTCFQAL